MVIGRLVRLLCVDRSRDIWSTALDAIGEADCTGIENATKKLLRLSKHPKGLPRRRRLRRTARSALAYLADVDRRNALDALRILISAGPEDERFKTTVRRSFRRGYDARTKATGQRFFRWYDPIVAAIEHLITIMDPEASPEAKARATEELIVAFHHRDSASARHTIAKAIDGFADVGDDIAVQIAIAIAHKEPINTEALRSLLKTERGVKGLRHTLHDDLWSHDALDLLVREQCNLDIQAIVADILPELENCLYNPGTQRLAAALLADSHSDVIGQVIPHVAHHLSDSAPRHERMALIRAASEIGTNI